MARFLPIHLKESIPSPELLFKLYGLKVGSGGKLSLVWYLPLPLQHTGCPSPEAATTNIQRPSQLALHVYARFEF